MEQHFTVKIMVKEEHYSVVIKNNKIPLRLENIKNNCEY